MWQPISTAPRVYTPPLSPINHHAPQILGLWGQAFYCICRWGGPSRPYWIGSDNKPVPFQPTRWQPLPPADSPPPAPGPTNVSGPAELAPQPAPGLTFDGNGVLRPIASAAGHGAVICNGAVVCCDEFDREPCPHDPARRCASCPGGSGQNGEATRQGAPGIARDAVPHPAAPTELPDDIRVPLHTLWADAGYMVGRAIAGERDLMVHRIKVLCDEVERRVRDALASHTAHGVEPVVPSWRPLPYSRTLDLWRAFTAGAVFVLHYHGRTFPVERMDPRGRFVYVTPPRFPVRIKPDGSSLEGRFDVWLEQAAAPPAQDAAQDELTDDMLRYAMAAMGTGSPADADKFRRFWRFAIEARNTRA